MKQQSIQNKLGTPYFNDSITQKQIKLPEGWLIYSYTGRIWLGAGDKTTDLLYIERVSSDIQEVPTILADGDIDMNLVSIGKTESIGQAGKGLEVTGYMRSKQFKGYLALVKVTDSHSYLILTATTIIYNRYSQKADTLAILEAIKGDLPKA